MTKPIFTWEQFKDMMVYFDGGMCTNIDRSDCKEIAAIANAHIQPLVDALEKMAVWEMELRFVASPGREYMEIAREALAKVRGEG